MKIIRKTTENEMIKVFLKGELNSTRFSKELEEYIKLLNIDKEIIINGDLYNEKQNDQRKKLLSEYRGFNKNIDLFENFPLIKDVYIVDFNMKDLKKIKYIDYDYWNFLSNGTSSPIEAAKVIESGKEIFNISNQPFIDGSKYLENGGKFDPCILVTPDFKTFTILEGHSRITCYGLKPNAFNNVQCFVIKCSPKDFKLWDCRY